MRRLLLVGVMALSAASAHAAFDWSSLWRTNDQRADQLMGQGKAQAAAVTYSDPRRKAYAELMAGDYAGAARDHAPFADSEAQYNRGNALAYAGDLAGAIKAYDAALAQDPHNADAKHNRDIVARAMQQNPQPSKKPGDGKGDQKDKKDSGGKTGNGSEKDKGDSKSDKGGSQSGAQKPGEQKPGDQKGADQKGNAHSPSDKPGSQNKADGANAGEGPDKPSPQAGKPAAQQKAADGSKGGAQPAAQGDAQAGQKADDKAQAKRDAEAALGQPDPGAAVQPKTAADAMSGVQNEKQLSQEQWLQRIPDDPGGLLRRKLLIEYMMRQRGGQP